MTLKSIRLRSFQSHKDSKIEFSDGINILVGDTSAGKTAILRGIERVAKNRPLGYRQHSHFSTDPIRIDLTVKDENQKLKLIEYIKHKSKTTYKVGKDPFSGAKGAVPDVVQDILQLSDINIQHQHDKPFLITDKPTEITQVINKALRIEHAEEWIQNQTKEINQLASEIKVRQGSIEETKGKLRKHKNVGELELLVSTAGELNDKVWQIDSEIVYARAILDSEIQLRKLDAIVVMQPKLEKARKLENEITKIDSNISELKRLLSVIATIKNSTNNADGQRVTALIRLKKLLMDMKTCPICSSPISKSQVEEVIDKLQ